MSQVSDRDLDAALSQSRARVRAAGYDWDVADVISVLRELQLLPSRYARLHELLLALDERLQHAREEIHALEHDRPQAGT